MLRLDDFAPHRPHLARGEVLAPDNDLARPLTGGEVRRAR
jgi:hypothetical protein